MDDLNLTFFHQDPNLLAVGEYRPTTKRPPTGWPVIRPQPELAIRRGTFRSVKDLVEKID